MKQTRFVLLLVFLTAAAALAQPIIADHACTDITKIPVDYVNQAKTDLHIAYGFTSHGSQIISGMTGLTAFMNGKGYSENLFAFNRDGSDGALHLFQGDGYNDGDLDHDAGYYPNWVTETRDYLGKTNDAGRGSRHPEINVIMWAWCGQLSWYSNEDVMTNYINEMVRLEADYPGVTFVYMTGHSDGSGLEGTLHQNNQTIRQHCENNNKVLFDYYDIECYDPDGNYFGDKHVNDDCSYDGGNWALDWQNSHTEGVDWYQCDAAHSKALNANQKAYAAWWLWARLAGWDGQSANSSVEETGLKQPADFELKPNYPNPFNSQTTVAFSLEKPAHARLAVFNTKGCELFQLINDELKADAYRFEIDLTDYPSGVYLYALQVDGACQAGKLLYSR